ncbi:nitroreductase family deazaflavin-dependent oxidoreductase [Nocardia sp. NPDC003482]
MTEAKPADSMFPPWLDRLQSKYFNPLIRPLAPYLPGLTLIEHRGRKSGTPYSTPVTGFRYGGNKFCVVLGHGRTDWAKNIIAAGEGHARMTFRRYHLTNPRLATRPEAGPDLPLGARLMSGNNLIFLADIT